MTKPDRASWICPPMKTGLSHKERRVARIRFILFSALLFIVLFGTLWWLLRNQ